MIFVITGYNDRSMRILNTQVEPLLTNIKDVYKDEENLILFYYDGYKDSVLSDIRDFYCDSNLDIIFFKISDIVDYCHSDKRDMTDVDKIKLNIHLHAMKYCCNKLQDKKLIAFIDTDILFGKHVDTIIDVTDDNDMYLSADFENIINSDGKTLSFNHGVFFCKNNENSLRFHTRAQQIYKKFMEKKLDLSLYSEGPGVYDQHIFKYMAYYDEGRHENEVDDVDATIERIKNSVKVINNSVKIKFYDLSELNCFNDNNVNDKTCVYHYKGYTKTLHDYRDWILDENVDSHQIVWLADRAALVRSKSYCPDQNIIYTLWKRCFKQSNIYLKRLEARRDPSRGGDPMMYSKKAILLQLKEEGFCVLKKFWPIEKCQQAINDILRMSKDNFEKGQGGDFRCQRSHMNSKIINDFFEDKSINDIAKNYSSCSLANRVVAGILQSDYESFYLLDQATHNYTQGSIGQALLNSPTSSSPTPRDSGGGWHVDSAVKHQFKAIMYLTDVSSKNGPFLFIPKSKKVINDIPKYDNMRIEENTIKEYFFEDDIEAVSYTHLTLPTTPYV